MTRYVLGISAFYHDSAAAILKDGKIIAAAQEERFTRRKHDPGFPRGAINYCLEEAEIDGSDLAAIAFYDDPALTADRIIRSSVAFAPESEKFFTKAVKSFFGVKPYFKEQVEEMLNCDLPIYFARHHYSHAASAFFPVPFRRGRGALRRWRRRMGYHEPRTRQRQQARDPQGNPVSAFSRAALQCFYLLLRVQGEQR